MPDTVKQLVKLNCIVCGVEFDGEEPKFCCSGRDCGCMGMPIDPIICSEECFNNLSYNKSKNNMPDEVKDIKTPEEILLDYPYYSDNSIKLWEEDEIISAIKEYAAQFIKPVEQKSAGVWVDAAKRLPENGVSVVCRKSYYADKSGTGKMICTIGKKNKKGDLSVIERWPATWEWLDEQNQNR